MCNTLIEASCSSEASFIHSRVHVCFSLQVLLFLQAKTEEEHAKAQMIVHTGSECPAPLIVISKINKVPFRTKRGRRARDLDWIVFWRDQLKMVLRCARCFVFWWESFVFLSFSCFFPPLRCLEMMLQASPNEKPCCWNFAADNLFLFLFSLQGTRYLNFSRLILGKAFSLFLPWRRWMLLLFLFFWESYHLQPCFYPPPACLESQLQRYPPVCLSTCLDFFLTWDWM